MLRRGHRRPLALALAALATVGAALFVVLSVTGSTQTATFAVNSTADAADANAGDGICATAAGVCTLRAAVQEANAVYADHVITLPAGSYLLTVTGRDEDAAVTGDLDLRTPITITGAGVASTVIDGNAIDRVFDVFSSANVTLSRLTVRNGASESSDGGGIRNTYGTLALDEVTVSNNAVSGFGFAGGGIFSNGTLRLMDVTIDNNRSNFGGGLSSSGPATLIRVTVRDNVGSIAGGGISNSANLALADVTISGNTGNRCAAGFLNEGYATLNGVTVRGNVARAGGGIRNTGTAILTNTTISGNGSGLGCAGGIRNDGFVELTNVTITANAAPTGAGIDNQGGANVKNTIIAANPGGNCSDAGEINSGGNNLEDSDTCGFTAQGDRVNTDPRLGPLADNGGPTETHALLAGSPAIDAGSNTGCPATDQRGQPRPRDGDGNGSALCDIGAFEAGAGPPAGSPGPSPSPTPTASPTSGPSPTPSPGTRAPFQVTSTVDAPDAAPGNGECRTGAGECTLRAAIQEANALAGPDTITLTASTYVLTIAGQNEDATATGDLDITGDLTISGSGSARTAVDGNALDRVFDILAGANVTISGVTVRGTNPSGIILPGEGGGIRNAGVLVLRTVVVSMNGASVGAGIFSSGTLTLEDVTISNNGGAGRGGALVSRGGATLTRVTVTNNSAGGGSGGGIVNEGTITLDQVIIDNNSARSDAGFLNSTGATATLTNVTISRNGASSFGGGGISNGGTLTLTNVTISGNSAPRGAGALGNSGTATLTNVTITNNGVGTGGNVENGGTLRAKNTIIANNTGPNCQGAITSEGNNLEDEDSCGFTATGDLRNTDPRLGPLANNGGFTPTQALGAGSPGIDAGTNSGCPATDQRGQPRPRDGDGNGSALCDIGAFEAASGGVTPSPTPSPTPTATPSPTPTPTPPPATGPRSFAVNSTVDAPDARPGDGQCRTSTGECTLRAAIQEGNALFGAGITLPAGIYALTRTGANEDAAASGDLDITAALTISGAGAAGTIVDGNATDRVFDILSAGNLTLSGVTARNGRQTGGDAAGGGIRNAGTLTLRDATLSGNAGGLGGGLASTTNATLSGVTISSNTAERGGGIANRGAATLANVTVNDNGATLGGGILNEGDITLTDGAIRGNRARTGGGIHNTGSASLTGVTLEGNTASAGAGGGIFNGGFVRLVASTARGNTATSGGGLAIEGSATLRRTTLAANIPSNCAVSGSLSSEGENVEDGASCGLTGSGDRSNAAP